jgi:uncharacterized protein (DUF1697 family)
MAEARGRSAPTIRLVAFLRAINVGGHNVTMEELRAHFKALGFKRVETFIASGNVIFETPSADATALERKIEGHLRKSLGYEVRTFIRTESELVAIARYRPFDEAQLRSARAFNVAFLAEPVKVAAKKSLMTLKTEIDDFHVHGREAYWLCRKKQSESMFFKVGFERILGARVTVRGMNTVVRLAARYAGSAAGG